MHVVVATVDLMMVDEGVGGVAQGVVGDRDHAHSVVGGRVHRHASSGVGVVHNVGLDVVYFAEVQSQVVSAGEPASTHRTRMWTGQRLDLLTPTGHTHTRAATYRLVAQQSLYITTHDSLSDLHGTARLAKILELRSSPRLAPFLWLLRSPWKW